MKLNYIVCDIGKIDFRYSGFERELIGDRVKSGVANKRAKLAAIGDNTWGRRETDESTQAKIKQLLAKGKSIRVIAKELKISPSTVMKWKGG